MGKKQPNKSSNQKGFIGLLNEYLGVALIALGVTLFIKIFLFQIFVIPSGSMENTLKIGDHVIVNRLASHFTPVARGEVLVFKDPDNWMNLNKPTKLSLFEKTLVALQIKGDPDKPLLIKRVIGIGGDHVQCCSSNMKVIVNGKEITEDYIYPGSSPSDLDFDIKVPKGYLFVMGDHRNNSADSRYHLNDKFKGLVPESEVLGRAIVVISDKHFSILSRSTPLASITPNKDYSKK